MNLSHITPAPGVVIPGAKPLDLTGDQIAIALSRHGRERLETFVAVAIDLLDLSDGDSDLEDADEDRCEAFEDDLHRPAKDRNLPGDPDDAEPEEDYGVDDVGEEDRVLDALVPGYSLDQSNVLARPDAVADLPCCDISIARPARPVLTLRYAGAAK